MPTTETQDGYVGLVKTPDIDPSSIVDWTGTNPKFFVKKDTVPEGITTGSDPIDIYNIDDFSTDMVELEVFKDFYSNLKCF